MRKDFSRITHQKFHASRFSGWTPVTELFKLLRNVNLHELPITIEMRDSKCIPLAHNNPALPPLHLKLSYTQALRTQLATDVPHTLSVERGSKGGSRSDVPLASQDYFFAIEGRDQNVARSLAKLHTDDVHILASECVATMRAFFSYFESELARASAPSRG